jgi:hypothetical protein
MSLQVQKAVNVHGWTQIVKAKNELEENYFI